MVEWKQNLNDMAGSSSSSSCDVAKLECPVCHQQFRDPKILHCLHSFCKNCICLVEPNGPTKVIVCPLCSQETKVDRIDKLKSSAHLVEKLKGFRIQEQVMKSPKTKLACDSCSLKSRKVGARCLDCSMYLCLSCKMVHLRIPSLSRHRVVSLDDLRSGKGLKTPRKETEHDVCTKHPGEKLKFFCQTCKEWICRDCRVAEHGSENPSKDRFCVMHIVVDSDLINSELRSWIKRNAASLEKAVTQFQSMLDTVTKAGPEFNNHAAILVEDVKGLANTIRKVIEIAETRLIKEINRMREEQEETLKGCTRKVNSALLEMKHAIETANEVADVPSDQDFSHLQPIIKDELSRLLKRKPSDLYNGLPLITVQKGGARLSLGRVEMGSRVTLPPPERRAKQDPATLVDTSKASVPAAHESSSKTSVPDNPEGSSKTSVPDNPGGSSKTSVPDNHGGSSKTSVPDNPGGSSKTSGPPNPGGSSKTSVPANPGGSSKTSVPDNHGGSSKTSVPANPGGSSKTSGPPNPGGSSKTLVPPNPGGSSKTLVPPNPGGSSKTSVPDNPGGSSKTSGPPNPGGSSKTLVPPNPGGSSKTLVPPNPGGSSKTLVPPKPGGSSKTLVPPNPGGSSKTSGPANPGVVIKSETDPELPGAKRKQITSEEASKQADEASKQADEARIMKRCKTEP